MSFEKMSIILKEVDAKKTAALAFDCPNYENIAWLIRAVIDTPLILHGGTGIPLDQLKQSFKLGINKLNLATEYVALFYSTMNDYQQIKDKKENYSGFYDYQKQLVLDYLRNKFA